MKADEKLKQSNIMKAATIICRFEFMLGHDIFRTPSEIMDKCGNSAELDYWYRIVCKNEFDEVIRI